MLEELLERIRDLLDVDTAAVLTVDPDGGQLVARAAKGLEEEVERGTRIPIGRGFAGRIAAERRAISIDDVDHADILNPLLRERGIKSLLGVPLAVEREVIGVLHVGSLRPRRFTRDEARLLQLAADRAALAIEHARLYEEERQTRRELEHIQAVTDASLAHLELDPLLDELLDRVREALASDTAAVLLLEEDTNDLVPRAAKGIEEVGRGIRIPVGAGFAGRVIADRRTVKLDHVDHSNVLNPILRERGVKSLLGAPLVVEGDAIGVLHVGTLTPRQFTPADERLLQLVADRAALAIAHARVLEEERLARAQAEARAQAAVVLTHVADGVILLDPDGRIRLWNPAAEAITGIAAAEALDRPVEEVISGWGSVRGLVPTASTGAYTTRAEVVPVEVEGRELWLSMSGAAFPGGAVYAFRDETTQRSLEERQADFVGTVAHEFRTPLASVYGAAETLLRREIEEDTREQLLRVVHSESQRLARFVDDVLSAAQLDAGAVEVELRGVDAASVVAAVVEAARAKAPAGIRIDVRAPETLSPTAADADKLRQVLVNLVENAVKYSPDGGAVTVDLERKERHVRIGVHDEGIGIEAQDANRVFEKFYRADPHMRHGIGGTGLGLYISRELVRRMNGRIWVVSKGHARGSSFYVELPVAQPLQLVTLGEGAA